jgi:hypothetical protein
MVQRLACTRLEGEMRAAANTMCHGVVCDAGVWRVVEVFP